MFFSSLKLQYCRTIALLNKLKLLKETSFSKATMVMRFPAKKNAGCPKTPRDSPPPQKKKHSPPPVGLSCDSSPPPQESVRAYADVTTKISRMDRLPNFLSYGALPPLLYIVSLTFFPGPSPHSMRRRPWGF